MIDINKAADFFILNVDEESGDFITHLKLQKLVYYAQAWYLALNEESLFNSRFEAWAHGPVSPSLYARFAGHGYTPISKSVAQTSVEDPDVLEHLKDVWRVYGALSPTALEQKTHSERPWLDARGTLGPLERCTTEIKPESMKNYYGEFLRDHGEQEG